MGGEQVDVLPMAGLQVLQAARGYRYTLDPLLLSGFCHIRKGERVVDLGTATGIIPLILAACSEAERIVGVEVQQALAERARRNVALNRLEGRIEIVAGDVRALGRGDKGGGLFDVALSNPPYRQLLRGRVAPNGERAACRHELHGGIGDFLQAAARLVRSRGRVYLVFLAERLAEVLSEMRALHVEPKRLRMVHSDSRSAAHLVLIEGRKDGRPGLEVEAPLVLYAGGVYTQDVVDLLGIAAPTTGQFAGRIGG